MPETEPEWYWDKQWICAIDQKGNPITLIDSSAKLAYYASGTIREIRTAIGADRGVVWLLFHFCLLLAKIDTLVKKWLKEL